MRKFGVFAGTILVSIILAGLYGILHDQITYSISPEYFTKFKYQQFKIDPATYGGDRQTVIVIGFLATWWMGYIIGIPVALFALAFQSHIRMRQVITKAIKLVFIVVLCFGFAGFLWGKFHLTDTGVNWWMPKDLIAKHNFIIVGSIHNFSYIGGIVGLLIALFYTIRQSIINNKSE